MLSFDAIDSVGDQLVGPTIQLTLITLLEDLHAARHGTKWFLQVVRGDGGELLQVKIGAGQFLGGFQQVQFRTLSLRDIRHKFAENTRFFWCWLPYIHNDFYGDKGAVFSP